MHNKTLRAFLSFILAWSIFELITLNCSNLGLFQRPIASASYWFHPITISIENCDLMIQGKVKKIVQRNRNRESLKTPTTITFTVMNSYPFISSKTIRISASGSLELGKEYIFPLKKVNNQYILQWGFSQQEDYLIKNTDNGPVVYDFFDMHTPIPLDEGWKIIRTIYDATHGIKPANRTEIEHYKNDLQNGTLEEACLASEFLLLYPQETITDIELIDALEAQYYPERHQMPDMMDASKSPMHFSIGQTQVFCRFAKNVVTMMMKRPSEESADRLVALYLKDCTPPSACVFSDYIETFILRYVVERPSPDRIQRLHKLFEHYPDSIIEQDRLGSELGMTLDEKTMRILAETPGEDIDAFIQEIFNTPRRFHLTEEQLMTLTSLREGLLQYRKSILRQGNAAPELCLNNDLNRFAAGEINLSTSILLRLKKGDTSAIPYLQKADLRYSLDIIRWKIPDPAFVPMLYEALHDKEKSQDLEYPLLSSLYCCGEKDAALKYARDILAEPMNADSLGAYAKAFADKDSAIQFLGEFGDTSDILLLKRYTSRSRVQAYRNVRVSFPVKGVMFPSSPSYRQKTSEIDKLYLSALLARTRLHDLSTIAKWKKLYRTGNTSLHITAAVALFYLDDDTSAPLIDLFRRSGELSKPRYSAHFYREGSTTEFSQTISYLRSPETDALLIERMQHGASYFDYDMTRNGAFMLEHASTIIPLMEKYLNDRNHRSRDIAKGTLELIIPLKLPWDINTTAAGNAESVARLRIEAERFLSQYTPLSTSGAVHN